ncbi:hypothetical protein F0562_019080 [Nyssa sinensis]|uniref:Uncharacterized protein n=1 Tax=Nyssa sinensis TaxID=561372 RepID=A0A5J4ZEY8_9ASTE|nr:hypothetical protein F0562_019080 [Nyssa sinensis]
MASTCHRIIDRASSSLSSLKSAIKPKLRAPLNGHAPTSSPGRHTVRRSSPFLKSPAEQLGCIHSLLPLHSAVAAARLNSCLSVNSMSCRALSQGTLCRTSPGL